MTDFKNSYLDSCKKYKYKAPAITRNNPLVK